MNCNRKVQQKSSQRVEYSRWSGLSYVPFVCTIPTQVPKALTLAFGLGRGDVDVDARHRDSLQRLHALRYILQRVLCTTTSSWPSTARSLLQLVAVDLV